MKLIKKNLQKKIIFLIIFFSLTQCKNIFDNYSPIKFTIYSGDKSASYYAFALGLCNVFNKHYSSQNFECLPTISKGSLANLTLLANNQADLAIIKTQEFNRFFIANSENLQKNSDFVSDIFDEDLIIITTKKTAIKNLTNLNNKVVNIGSDGSTSALITKKYFTNFAIKPKIILNLSASQSLKKLCKNEIDGWIYFIGHPNLAINQALENCDLEVIKLSKKELNNFRKIAPFLKAKKLTPAHYRSLKNNILTVSSSTILASQRNFNSQIIGLIQDILENHRAELIEQNQIFKNF